MSSTDAFRLLVLTDAHSATSVEETAGAPAEMPCRLGVELVRRAIDDARHRGGFDAVALLADMLAATGTAAEINCHLNSNDPEFFAQCIARGVKIAFGSDAHRLSEVGNLGPHLQLLREAAGAGDPATLRKFLL